MSQHHADRPDVPRDPIRPPDSPPRRQLPMYRVVLHQDACLDLMFVVRTVMELTRFCRAEATHKMWQAHHCGRSVLLLSHRERAELYAEQLAARGLTVSVEPA
jgi:ATP-dependent Clp protease adapter protein ClpS